MVGGRLSRSTAFFKAVSAVPPLLFCPINGKVGAVKVIMRKVNAGNSGSDCRSREEAVQALFPASDSVQAPLTSQRDQHC